MSDEIASPRPGSTQDLSRRMDRIEQRQDSIETEVRTLAATVARVEQNQAHATELNKLRFDALDTGLKSVSSQLTDFIRRVEGLVSGEIQTAQTKAGQELVADYREWRGQVDVRLDNHDRFETQGRLLGRIGVLVVSSNLLAIAAAVYAIVR